VWHGGVNRSMQQNMGPGDRKRLQSPREGKSARKEEHVCTLEWREIRVRLQAAISPKRGGVGSQGGEHGCGCSTLNVAKLNVKKRKFF